jgi:hypothetical protein
MEEVEGEEFREFTRGSDRLRSFEEFKILWTTAQSACRGDMHA